MNALHRPANFELQEIFDDFENDSTLGVAILTGAGDRAFCAGNDLKYMSEGNDTSWPLGGFGGITARFNRTKPIIAAVNGHAHGGGFEIALSCDLIIASENATFSLPEPRVGLAARAGGLLRLPECIHLKQAMGMILTGRRVTASEGIKLGFINEVTPTGSTLDVAKRWASQILECSPLAISASMEVVRAGLSCDFQENIYNQQTSLPRVKALYESPDRIEGPKAFTEKRKPNWATS